MAGIRQPVRNLSIFVRRASLIIRQMVNPGSFANRSDSQVLEFSDEPDVRSGAIGGLVGAARKQDKKE